MTAMLVQIRPRVRSCEPTKSDGTYDRLYEKWFGAKRK
jgi:hypothetical protein